MTEKRFSYRYNSDKDGSEFEIIDLDKDEYYPMIETIETVVMALVDCLNNLHDENEQLKSENERLQHFESIYRQRTLQLEKENEQLKQRNDRQAKRLAELYELMAKKDWESLTEIIDDFCSCEEQLQRESGTYGGFE